jgi:hypothetical protein
MDNATQNIEQATETLRQLRARQARKARQVQARLAFEAAVCELRRAMGHH